MSFKLNAAPTNGTCEVTPLSGVSLVDDFSINCAYWFDPEEIGIKRYSVKS